MQIIIIGGGIGGLAAAIALTREGHDVKVLEKAPEPRPLGAGISLQPNAMQALGLLGLTDQIAARGYEAQLARLRLASGKVVKEFDFSPYLHKYGYLPATIHRADLFDILHQAALNADAEICFGLRFKKFLESEQGVEVCCEDGSAHTCDALIGADGIHSLVRAQLWGEQSTRYAGYVCWRGIVDEPELVNATDEMHEFWGEGARFGYMRCSPDKIYWFATKTSPNDQAPLSNWQQTYQGWPHPIAKLIEATPPNQIAYHPICDRAPLFPWSRGRVTLLGDAAHPMTPNFGQGGAQAIEDAVVLAKKIANIDQPVAAFQRYERHRNGRTRALVNGARQLGKIAQGGNRFWRCMRSALFPLTPESVLQARLDQQFDFHAHLSE